MSLDVNVFEQRDFSGGMTDDYIDCDSTAYKYAWNCLISAGKEIEKRPGSRLYDENNPQIQSAARIGNIFKLGSVLFFRSGSDIYYIDTTFQTIVGPSGFSPFAGATDQTSIAWSKYFDHIIASTIDYINPIKLILDSNSDPAIYTAGLPALASDPSGAGTGGAETFLYAFCYAHTYNVETVEYLTRGPITQIQVENVNAPNTNQISITAIPTLSNGTTLHYDTSNVVIEIYRTTNGGTLFYKVDEVTNGTTGYNDTTSDDDLTAGERLYTTGGVVENNAPPLCKYVHVVNEVCYYANIKSGTELIKNRVYQSKLGIFDAVPGTFYIDVEDEIKGISSYNANPIIFCSGSIYRLDGRFDNLGRGGISYQRISDTTGCINHDSIVQTLIGVFFAGNNGFYWTDGYSVRKISDGLNTTYQKITNTTTKQQRIQGAYDNLNRRVYWTCQYFSKSTDNDACLVLDTRWPGTSEYQKSFTQTSGNSYSPTAIFFDSGDMIRGHRYGYILRHDNNLRSDPKIDIDSVSTELTKEAIIQRFLDGARSYGSTFNRKFVPRAQIVAENVGDVAIQLNGYNDDKTQKRPMKEIRALGNFVWGDPNFVWGDESCVWNSFNIIKQQRRLPAQGRLRCLYFQLEVTNSFTILGNSDTLGTATVTHDTKKITLDDSDFSWLLDCEDYKIYFSDDDYDTGFNISARDSDNVITVEDNDGVLPADGSYGWTIKGYGKNHSIVIQNLLTHYVPFSMSHTMYDGVTGENA